MCCLIVLHLQGLFQDLNPSKCLVYSSLLLFVVLFGLRIDRLILWNYYIVFIPLWIWKVCALAGATTGTVIWVKHPEYRRENSVDMQAMFIATSFHVLLLFFEVMTSTNLEYNVMPYRVVFIPMYGMSVLSFGGCVWGYKNERQLELEAFFSLNLIQFVCLSLKWDHVIRWSWVIVFIPVWIILTLVSVWVLYYVILALLSLRLDEVTETQRRTRLASAFKSSIVVISSLAFMVMLTRKLGGYSTAYYSTVFIPLEITLAVGVMTSFQQKAGNPWWFGMRKDFCEFLLDSFPLLREYGNVSVRPPDPNGTPASTRSVDSHRDSNKKKKDVPKIVGTILVIDMPD